jgi:2-succinyl-5-enolpyruvyl-6-hydroxy-3-cyclohexene-1-carboxylate synthase
MPIRDVEWYGMPRDGLVTLANRGANGIDGVLSSALGVALGAGVPTAALVGDLAFLYDASALPSALRSDVALTIVVVDNSGGGIFSFLPQASSLPSEQFERYWGTPHGVDIAAVAGAYGAERVDIAGHSQLEALLADAMKPGVRVGIVRSERSSNVAAHDQLHRAIAEAIDER